MDVAFQNLVVGVLVHHDRPGVAARSCAGLRRGRGCARARRGARRPCRSRRGVNRGLRGEAGQFLLGCGFLLRKGVLLGARPRQVADAAARVAAAPPEEDRRAKKAESQATPARRGSTESAPASRIDLHGMSVDEAIARVVKEIDQAIRRGADRVEVVHGKGSGRIRDALHRELAALPVVASFRLDPQNAGVTWVYL